jgi:hypothetical protein
VVVKTIAPDARWLLLLQVVVDDSNHLPTASEQTRHGLGVSSLLIERMCVVQKVGGDT